MLTVQTPAAAMAAAGLGGTGSVPLDDPAQAQLHLATLARPDTFIELRLRARTDGGWVKRFFESPRAAADLAITARASADVYVGVLPRTRAGYGGDALPEHGGFLWAEADNQMAMTRTMNFTPAAHMLIRSSPGKVHAYWALERDIPLDYVVRGNQRLAHHLGCDPAATTKGRILRVAGTANHKRGEAHRVALVRFDARPNIPARDIVGDLPDPAPPQPLAAVAARVRSAGLPADADTEALRSVPARVYIPALSGREVLRGLCQCPFHKGGQESTPSLSVGGPRDELWICFGCDASGDVFRFAAMLWGLNEKTDFVTLKTRLKEALR